MIPTILTNHFSRRVRTDNLVFQLHYRWTVVLLILCSLVVTCRLVLGHSFSCMELDKVPHVHLETKCYSDGVYSLPVQLFRNSHGGSIGNPSGHHGGPTRNPSDHGFRRYQRHYQWVNLLFLVQAALFYLPHLLWKSYDSGSLERLTRGLETCHGTKDDRRGTELCYLAKYVLTTQGRHKTYAAVHISCEVFNYAIALAQTLWLVHFFAVTGVPDFLPFDVTTWSDFQKFYFPSSGTCSTSFGKVHHTTACLLPLNRLYMFMFLFVHAWYICLTVLSGTVLVYRIVLMAPSQRVAVVKASCPWAEKETLTSLCRRLSYSDWFFLTRFQRVLSDIDFAQMLDKIAIVSACKTCDVLRDENGSLSSVDGHKDLESLADESPV